jgi:sulfur-oxidizing protein SoxZ
MSTQTLVTWVPKSPRAGDVVEIRALVGHPMETGFRSDDQGKPVPRHLITNVSCHVDGVLVLRATWYPSVSANPLFTCHVKAVAGGMNAVLHWTGDHGFDHTERMRIDVAA